MIADPNNLDRQRGPLRSMAHALKRRIVRWALDGVAIGELKVGNNTITMSPGGADLIRWDTTEAAVQLGDLGMNVTTGRPSAFVGGADAALPVSSEVMLLDGTQAMTGGMDLGGGEITNLAEPTALDSAATRSYVDTRIAPAVDVGASGAGYIGTASIAEIDALTPVIGDAVVAEDAGTPAAGTSSALVAGDLAEFDGTSWTLIVGQAGGFPPNGTRAMVATTSTFTTGGGLTSSTDEGKLVSWDGTQLIQTAESTPVDGNIVIVRGNGAVNENSTFTFDGVVPTGTWQQSGGVGADHGALTGLADDDHAQYALLLGRGASQTISGGANASGNLVLRSTSNASKGEIQIESGSSIVMQGNDDFIPVTDDTGELGTDTNRWNRVRATTVVTGDLEMRRYDWEGGGGEIAWKLREYPNGIRAVNLNTGDEFDLVLKRRGGVRGTLRRALGL